MAKCPAARPCPRLPPPVDRSYLPLQIDDPGWWLNLGDTHIPYHDVRTIELAVEEARKAKVVGVLLNGDIVDSHELSRFDKDPTAPRYTAERDACLAFLSYLRSRLPKARIVYKAGNHEDRLTAYLLKNAPALYGLKCVQFDSIFELERFGVEYVGDCRVVRLGKLNVIHGHEYRPQVQTPVNPARGVFLRAKSVVLTNHFHQTSEHHEPTITGEPQAAWSVGCACQLAPRYMPLNKWNHGYCVIRVDSDGTFAVRNRRVLATGKV